MIIRSISIEENIDRKLEEHCKKSGRKVSSLISILLKKYLESQEDVQ
jgi:metal-responsive CopG/Arc/MetJ family transcriptional regulator